MTIHISIYHDDMELSDLVTEKKDIWFWPIASS